MKKKMLSITDTNRKPIKAAMLYTALTVALAIFVTACATAPVNSPAAGDNSGNSTIGDNTVTLSDNSNSSSQGPIYALPDECATVPYNVPTSTTAESSPDSSVEAGGIIKLGGVEWRVLDIVDGKALVLSDKILSKREYNIENVAITWENCDLRKYLNGQFYDSVFSAEEKQRILETTLANEDNPWFGPEYQYGVELISTSGGNDTTDKIFLLSISEVIQYFGNSGALLTRQEGDTFLTDQFNENRVAKTEAGVSMWWLRSPGNYYHACGSNHSFASCITMDGLISVHGDYVFNGNIGVRPAMWVSL